MNEPTTDKFVEAEVNDFIPDVKKGLKNDFTPQANERNCYHVELVKSKFDTKTGKDNSIRHIQKLEKEEWTNFEKNKERLGFDTVNILWNPNNQ